MIIPTLPQVVFDGFPTDEVSCALNINKSCLQKKFLAFSLISFSYRIQKCAYSPNRNIQFPTCHNALRMYYSFVRTRRI